MNLLALLFLSAATQTGIPDAIGGRDLAELLRRWPAEYVRWILTDGERERYERLGSDEERLRFIEEFWARRDPFPETPENEYRTEYRERFAYVLDRFAAGKPGWATDRGRIYLLLGPPHSVQQNPMGRSALERPSEIWTYNDLPLPGVPASLDISFVDFKGTGDYEIVSDLDATAPVLTRLGTAESNLLALAMRRGRMGLEDPRTGRERYREVDSTRLVMRELDLQQQLREIEDPERSLQWEEIVRAEARFDRLSVRTASGVIPFGEDRMKVPVSLSVPYAELTARTAPDGQRFELEYLVRIVGEDGNEAAGAGDRLAFRLTDAQYARARGLRLSIEESLHVAPGRYRLQALLRDASSGRVGVDEQELAIEAPPDEGLALSSLFVASELVKGVGAGPQPFQFGNVRVVPSPDRSFTSDREIHVYLQAYGARPGADGRKRIRVDLFVLREGKLVLGAPASHLFPDTEPVAISASLPLRRCAPGDYVLRVRVTDELSGERAERDAAFHVQPDGPGASFEP